MLFYTKCPYSPDGSTIDHDHCSLPLQGMYSISVNCSFSMWHIKLFSAFYHRCFWPVDSICGVSCIWHVGCKFLIHFGKDTRCSSASPIFFFTQLEICGVFLGGVWWCCVGTSAFDLHAEAVIVRKSLDGSFIVYKYLGSSCCFTKRTWD